MEREDGSLDGEIEQHWQKEKSGRILESPQLGLMQMIGLLQDADTRAEAATAAESSGQRVYAAACRVLEEK